MSSTGSLQFTTLVSGKGERRGWWWENVPLEMCTNSPSRLHQLPTGAPVSCKCLPPAPSYLNISVTSPLANATRTGKPIQAGTRYKRAGCKRTQGGEVMLGRATASQWLGLNPGLSTPRPRMFFPGRGWRGGGGKKPKETQVCGALTVPRSLAGSVPITRDTGFKHETWVGLIPRDPAS